MKKAILLLVAFLIVAFIPSMVSAQDTDSGSVVAILTVDNGTIYAEYEDGTIPESGGTPCIGKEGWRYYIINGTKIWYRVQCEPDVPKEADTEPVRLFLEVFDDGTVNAEFEDGSIPESFETSCFNGEVAGEEAESQLDTPGECCEWWCTIVHGDIVCICIQYC